MKLRIVEILYKALDGKLTTDEISQLLEIPPDDKLGDFAFPCFSLAKQWRRNPNEIATELATAITAHSEIGKANAVTGYLNIYVRPSWLCETVLNASIAGSFGRGEVSETTVVEYCSPNTNKPLHLGHLRNMAIGESVSRILEFLGNRVHRTCVFNDRGVHICKSMLAYREFGNNRSPEDDGLKSDHFVGKFYVLFAKYAKEDAAYEKKAQDMLEAWERGDEETIALWRKMNGWALTGFKDTFMLFGIGFEKEFYESEIYKHGKEIILDGLLKGLFIRRDDGAVIADLTKYSLDEKVLLRSNGTSVYIVQDIYLAALKSMLFSPKRSIYVVGNEQEYHFNALKAILNILDTSHATGIHHLSYGMVELPEGKMKSREGTVVDADDLVRETSRLAEEEINSRYDLPSDQVKARAQKIALAAIKYELLRIETAKNMMFNPKEAIRFEGNTGPYLLYSYARASSILRKVTAEISTNAWDINEHEARLLKKLSRFPETVASAGNRLVPSLLASYAFELCQIFNQFFHECPVMRSEVTAQRLALVQAFRSVAGNCLDLLGIEKVEEM